jgi:hypothetical protein
MIEHPQCHSGHDVYQLALRYKVLFKKGDVVKLSKSGDYCLDEDGSVTRKGKRNTYVLLEDSNAVIGTPDRPFPNDPMLKMKVRCNGKRKTHYICHIGFCTGKHLPAGTFFYGNPRNGIYWSLDETEAKALARKRDKILRSKTTKDGTWSERDSLGRIIVHDNAEVARLQAAKAEMEAQERAYAGKLKHALATNDFSTLTNEEKKRYLTQIFKAWIEEHIDELCLEYAKMAAEEACVVYGEKSPSVLNAVLGHLDGMGDTEGAARLLSHAAHEGVEDMVYLATSHFDGEESSSTEID